MKEGLPHFEPVLRELKGTKICLPPCTVGGCWSVRGSQEKSKLCPEMGTSSGFECSWMSGTVIISNQGVEKMANLDIAVSLDQEPHKSPAAAERCIVVRKKTDCYRAFSAPPLKVMGVIQPWRKPWTDHGQTSRRGKWDESSPVEFLTESHIASEWEDGI